MPECKHEMEEATCGVCTPPGRVSGRRRFGPWFAAQFGGHCAGCQAELEQGEMIRSDGDGGWLCGTCGSAGPVDAGLGSLW